MGGERPGQTRDAGAQNDDVPGIAHVGAGRKNSTKPAMAGDYAGGWRDVAGVAAAIAAVTLSGRVNAKYSRANSGGRISTPLTEACCRLAAKPAPATIASIASVRADA